MGKNEKLKDIIGEGAQDDEMKQKILELIDENPSEEARDAFATLNSKVSAVLVLCGVFSVWFMDFYTLKFRWRLFSTRMNLLFLRFSLD